MPTTQPQAVDRCDVTGVEIPAGYATTILGPDRKPRVIHRGLLGPAALMATDPRLRRHAVANISSAIACPWPRTSAAPTPTTEPLLARDDRNVKRPPVRTWRRYAGRVAATAGTFCVLLVLAGWIAWRRFREWL